MKTHVRINNRPDELSLDLRLTLLDALRDVLGLTGTKKGCDQLGHEFTGRRSGSPLVAIAGTAGSTTQF